MQQPSIKSRQADAVTLDNIIVFKEAKDIADTGPRFVRAKMSPSARNTPRASLITQIAENVPDTKHT